MLNFQQYSSNPKPGNAILLFTRFVAVLESLLRTRYTYYHASTVHTHTHAATDGIRKWLSTICQSQARTRIWCTTYRVSPQSFLLARQLYRTQNLHPPGYPVKEYGQTNNIAKPKSTVHFNFFFSWLDSPSGPRPFLWGSLITLKHTTLGRTTLDEWSARHRDLYLTTLTKNRHPCPRRVSNPQSQQASRRRTTL
jgi:hypothetical protein